jgi:hypothetical protein
VELIGDALPRTSIGAVVDADVGRCIPCAHLRDHTIQSRLDAGMQRVQVGIARGSEPHAPRRAHGFAAERGDGLVGGVSRQADYCGSTSSVAT